MGCYWLTPAPRAWPGAQDRSRRSRAVTHRALSHGQGTRTGWELLAFSCKKRGFCPSCVGRRMSDVAAHLVDEVFPEEVPMRQWVCSLPWALR